MDAPELVVGPLGTAEPLPEEFAADLEASTEGTWSDLAADDAAAGMSDEWIVHKLTPLAKAPFALIALRAGAHWRVTDEEVMPILEAVAQSIPRTALTEAVVKRSPILAAALAAIDLVTTRMAISQRLAEAEAPANGGTPDEPTPGRVLPFGIGRRAPRAAPSRPDPALDLVAPGDGARAVVGRELGDVTPDGSIPVGAVPGHLRRGGRPS